MRLDKGGDYMTVDRFASLLEELSNSIHFPLRPDGNNSCLLRMPGGLQVQLEMYKKNDSFLIGADLGNVPVGRYRENLFKEALRANYLPPPRYGIFAYTQQKDSLILFSLLPLEDLTGEKIAAHLMPFTQKALQWQLAIKRGEIPEIEDTSKPAASMGRLFGL